VYLESHDQPRIVSHFGSDLSRRGGRYWERSAKLLALLELTLRGTPFIYQGQEIGMTNFDFKRLDQLNDVESHNLNRLMKKMHIPGWLRWRWIRPSSRDNARTPVQWNPGPNAGFSGGRPWLGVNGNYRRINYEAQKDDPESVLNFYKKLIRLRLESECLKSGVFIPLRAGRRFMAYRRELGDEAYTVLLNFSDRSVPLPELPFQGQAGGVLVSNTGRKLLEGKLLPWEAALIKQGLS
jgi:oligo-1,6-glucosidase